MPSVVAHVSPGSPASRAGGCSAAATARTNRTGFAAGRPLENARPSTTVRAPDAKTADAVAAVVNVAGWASASPLLAGLPEVGVLIVNARGSVQRAGNWQVEARSA